MNLWQRKLLAFLHDPPSKPFNIVEHRALAGSLIRNAGFDPADVAWFFDKICDHTAAAADRVVCPKSTALKAGWDAMSAFKHPLGGGELRFDLPINPTDAEAQVAAKQPHGQPHGFDWSKVSTEAERQDWARFFIHWRLWRQLCSEAHPSLAHMPADTRIPDHTIWTHCSIVSALQTCVQYKRDGDECRERVFRPAFLLVQIGPVQEFIAQARTTRDLWSGSYLLSWLIAHGIKAVSDEIGPDAVMYPSLRGQPLFDFLHKESLYDKLNLWNDLRHSQEQILTPNLPNRFLAVVPEWLAQQLAVVAEKAMRDELQRIGDACAKWLNVEDTALARWNQQLRQFLNVTWQTWTWEHEVAKAVDKHPALKPAYNAAIHGIPTEHLDPRNYRHRSKQENGVWKSEVCDDPPVIDNHGFAWAAHYAETDRLLAARRNTRDFEVWAAEDDHRAGAVKDMLSGKEEVIGSEPWQEALPDNIKGHYFKPDEKLGALNLIKRVWHRAYLDEKRGLKRTPKFDSLPAVAAAPYARKMWPDPVAADFLHLAHNADAYFENGSDDASVFHLSEWERAIKAEHKRKGGPRREALEALQAAGDALKKLGGAPSRYVAVLALDGDSMGKWVSGENAPHWRDQLAREAIEYFEQHEKLKALLDKPRHVSPSYHLQLSEALANFALYLAGPIVEHYDGQLIYAGGDDVVAMLPAENALKCAQALRMAFRGEPNLRTEFDGALDIGEQAGFVGLNADADIFKRTKRFVPRGYPLIVPGNRADISAGIAIGHMHSPLQNLVEAARDAEKRAKKEYGKAAFAVSLFKRSGETIQWGAKWESKAIKLANEFTRLSEGENPILSAKFPYALARLLRAYAIGNEFKIAKQNGFDPFTVFPAEFAHCVKQHGPDAPASFSQLAGDYLKQCEGRRLDDFLGPFLTTTFINRGGGE
jgi:CRISPR-associated protein Cmr2